MKRPVAVTGLGVWCSIGRDAPSFWRALLDGRSGVRALTRFPAGDMRSRLVAEAEDPGGEEPNRSDRLALAAAREALASAGLRSLPAHAGLALGAGVGGLPESEEAYLALRNEGTLADKLHRFLGHVPATTADLLAGRLGGGALRVSVANACTSSTVAVGEGALWIAEGETDCVLAGASDALTLLTVGGFNSLRVVTPSLPRPFDRARSGMVVGEGAAFLVLESAERAERRGARALALVEGFGLSSDAYHATAPEPAGDGALRAMRQALATAGLGPEAVDHINAHGTGTVANDRAEANAIRRLLGDRAGQVPVVSIKGAVGHCLGAAGAVEAAASVLSLLHQTVPPCAGFAEADPEVALDVPAAPRRCPLRRVLSVSLAFGGNNAAVLFGRAP